MVTIEDCVEAEELVKADKGIQALLRERYGITDMSMVAADPWFYGDRFGELPACHLPYTVISSARAVVQLSEQVLGQRPEG